MVELMEDARRKRISSRGRIEALCTLCEVEGRPYVPAGHEYVVVSTENGEEKRITVCDDHSEQLDKGRLSFTVVRKRNSVDWAHPL